MRQRTDSRSGKAPSTVLEKNFREIVVGSGRSQEPYVIAFHYASDNVSGSPLGTLFGFFEVEIHDQDAAYIVNFLASVAKKEYFANPRRSPIESFEAALHKINVALAEIVKHGNVSWLGHLHGAIGAASENSLNFSVTGEGELYLAREESLRSISEGLAETGDEPHPLKTFTEVSSGDLHDGDLIFALSPSIWSLFSPEDLRRSLNRLGPAGFEQFLRTALVNELPVAAVALLTCSSPVELKKVSAKEAVSRKPAISLGNVWSDRPFTEALEAKTDQPAEKTPASSMDAKPEEYTDKKTGHIYVQASSDEMFEETDNHWKERWELYSQELGVKLRSLQVSARKMSRRTSKESTLAIGALMGQLAAGNRSIGRRARTLKRAAQSRWENYQQERIEKKRTALLEAIRQDIDEPLAEAESEEPSERAIPSPSPLQPSMPERVIQPSDRVRKFFNREPRPEVSVSDWVREQSADLGKRIPVITSAVSPAFEKLMHFLKSAVIRISRQFFELIGGFRLFWNARSSKQLWLLVGGATLCLGLLAYFVWPNDTVQPTEAPIVATEEAPIAPVFPPASEPKATLLSTSRSLSSLADGTRVVAFTPINVLPFLVTDRSVVNLATQESVPAPEPIRLAAAMDDLDSIFLIAASGTLYNYSIATKQFAQNTLPLPVGAKIDAIGAYLTYLYALDRDRGTLQRFPRTEGGFGAPANWLKESITLSADGSMAIFENVALTLKNKEPALYSRGVRSSAAFAGTVTLVTANALAFDQQKGDLFVLDRANKRIVRWSATGELLAQYFHESLADTETFAVSPDGAELFVSSQGKIAAWQIL